MRLLRYFLVTGLILITLATAGLLREHFGYSTALSGNTALQALLSAYTDESALLDVQTRTSGCHVQGALPDHDCSPGAVFAEATVEQICTPGYSSSVRSVSTSLKKKVYAAYGISYPQPTGSYEMDHLIPLELGGNNDAANLFPEAAAPAPGFKEKDVVEDYLHQEVCAGRANLAAAQKQIATDWVAVYQTLSPDMISAIKGQFRNWAD